MIFGETLSTGVIRDLLEFESEKYGIPFYVSITDLNDYADSVPVTKNIEVYINSGPGTIRKFTFKDTTVNINNVHLPYEAKASEDAIYGVSRNKIFIGFDIESYKDEPWINSLFAAIFDKVMPGIADYMNTESESQCKNQYLRIKRHIVEEQVKSMKEDIRSNADEIDDKTNEIKELTTKNYTLAQAISSISNVAEGIVKKNALSEFEGLMKLTPDPVTHIELEPMDGKIIVYTSDISIEHEDTTYSIGRFRIAIDPVKSTVKFENLVKKVKGYHHPHISESGIPCLGNISSTVYYLLIHQEILQLVSLLIEFLKSYNEENPYKTIEHWDENYDEEDEDRERYEHCYEERGPIECVTCDDRDCQYHRDAQNRCREMHAFEDCLICDIEECDFARDYESCFQEQTENHTSECRTCGITQCSHNRRQPVRA